MNKKLLSLLTVVFATSGAILLLKSAGELLNLDLSPLDLEDE